MQIRRRTIGRRDIGDVLDPINFISIELREGEMPTMRVVKYFAYCVDYYELFSSARILLSSGAASSVG